jgi:hypothetical protein
MQDIAYDAAAGGFAVTPLLFRTSIRTIDSFSNSHSIENEIVVSSVVSTRVYVRFPGISNRLRMVLSIDSIASAAQNLHRS